MKHTKFINYLIFFCLIFFVQISFGQTFTLPQGNDNIIGNVQTVLSHPGDDFHSIARRYDIGFYSLIEANPTLDPKAVLPTGTLVIIPTEFTLPSGPREGVVVNLAELRLYYYPPHSDKVITYPVGIGREGWRTPLGTTKIVLKRKDPTWIVPESIRKFRAKDGVYLPREVPPGPDNPLGDYAMNLGFPTYVIHGTNEPSGVGMRSGSGCIRLYPEDIKSLFYMVKNGTKVRIINQPYKTGINGNFLYLEAHLPLQEDEGLYAQSYAPLVNTINQAVKNENYHVFWQIAEQVSTETPGYPIIIGEKG